MDLSITQAYFVCAVNEKGKISSFNTEKLVCMVAAALLELQMEGVISIDGKTVAIKSELPSYMEYLHPVYQFLNRLKPVKIEKILEEYNYSFSDRRLRELMASVGDSLVGLGAARENVGLWGKKSYVPKRQAIDEVVDMVRSELIEEGQITEDVTALTILLDKGKCLKKYFSDYERRNMRQRLKEIVNNHDGRMVTRMIEYVENMIAMFTVLSVGAGASSGD